MTGIPYQKPFLGHPEWKPLLPQIQGKTEIRWSPESAVEDNNNEKAAAQGEEVANWGPKWRNPLLRGQN